ncbi:MAG: O-antigen ligase family protein [Gemmataceae bacterium]|nr:O-antigen ligase family protein [Gemmataceae bacterium]
MDFALFVALNGVLLLRPDDLFPELAGFRMYLVTIAACVLAAAPRLVEALRPSALLDRPVTACVLGFVAAGALSHAARGFFGVAVDFLGDFGKVGLYYLLLTAVVDSRERLRAFLGWLVVMVGVLAGLGLLQFYEVVDIPAMRPIEDRREVDPETGELVLFAQLRSFGLFNDPNDLCLILVAGTVAAAYRAASAGSWAAATPWLVPAGAFLYSIMLTKSRGGLLGLMVAVASYLLARYGWRRAVPLAAVVLPAAVVLFAGRQTDFSSSNGAGDTANQRFQFWSEGFQLLRTSAAGPQTPLTGVGPGEFVEHIRHVAHNSFVHAFVETGLIGGTLFAGAFALAALGVYLAPAGTPGRNPPDGLRFFRPFVFAQVVGFSAGIFSLSRCYVVPTYLILGLATAYLGLAVPNPPAWFRVTPKLGVRLAAFGVVAFIGLYLLTRVLVRY